MAKKSNKILKLLQKLLKLHIFLWAICGMAAILGIFAGFWGAHMAIENFNSPPTTKPVELYYFMGCGIALGLSGVFATAATKYQQREEAREAKAGSSKIKK